MVVILRRVPYVVAPHEERIGRKAERYQPRRDAQNLDRANDEGCASHVLLCYAHVITGG